MALARRFRTGDSQAVVACTKPAAESPDEVKAPTEGKQGRFQLSGPSKFKRRRPISCSTGQSQNGYCHCHGLRVRLLLC